MAQIQNRLKLALSPRSNRFPLRFPVISPKDGGGSTIPSMGALAIPATDPNRGFETFGTIFGWVVFGLVVLLVGALVLRHFLRRWLADQEVRAMVHRDAERERLQLQWLRGEVVPDLAPHELYLTEWEYDEDRARMAGMGFTVSESRRLEYEDGTVQYDVRWHGDVRALQRAQRELGRVDRRKQEVAV